MDDPRFDARSVHPASGATLERCAWRTVRTASGTQLRSTRREWSPAGAGFVAVLDRSGSTVLGWWATQHWSTTREACTVVADLVAAAGRGVTDTGVEFGDEYVALLGGGSLRAAFDGSHIRVVGADGATALGGLGFWTCGDLAAEPGTVMAELFDAVTLLT